MERDSTTIPLSRVIFISTHTLTWSVTNPAYEPLVYINISTHTLTWSVTLLQCHCV